MTKSKLLSYDAFAKTDEEVRVRTQMGGLITLVCIIATLVLLSGEWTQFNTLVNIPQLVVDRDSNAKLDLNLDITFPSVPCDIINLDIMDAAGNLQFDILESGFTKIRIDANGKELETVGFNADDVSKGKPPSDEDYCGPCYGSRDQSKNKDAGNINEKVCCQNCNDVRTAYMEVGWAFFDGKDIEQCEREGFVEEINKHLSEGCRLKGNALLNRIEGHLHFAPGKGFETKNGHYHDLSLYQRTPNLNFNHIINHFSFGKPIEAKAKVMGADILTQPLDGRSVVLERDTHFHKFSYYTKVVPTRYEYLNKVVAETAQFSATYHDKPLIGGHDEDHPTTLHSRSGIPGVFFYFEMSSLKVINKERIIQTWSGFILNCFTVVGGVLAVGSMVDRLSYTAQKSIWGKKSK